MVLLNGMQIEKNPQCIRLELIMFLILQNLNSFYQAKCPIKPVRKICIILL